MIPEALGSSLSRAVGFRDLLVHQYASIDNSRVVSMLAELDDLNAFVDAVGRWLETDDPPA